VSDGYAEQLIYAATDDDVLLAGMLIQPEAVADRFASILLIHGNAAAFYDPPYVRLGRALATLGYAVLIGNTRGHDIAATLWKASSGMPFAGGGGSGWERMEDAPRDVAAWVRLLQSRQAQRIVVAGHSKGAQKVILYGMEAPVAEVRGIVLASPDLRGMRIPGELEAARQMVAEGRGMDVLPAQVWAPWYRQSAQAVVSHAETVDRYFGSEMAGVTALRLPVLAFFGSRETGAEASLEAIRNVAGASVATRLIDGADHFYSGHEEEIARMIADWTGTLAG